MSDDTVDDGFSPSWLQLREPADHSARDQTLTTTLAQWASRRDGLQVMELGTGTGSNLRYLCPQLGEDQTWLLIDHDARLLAALADTLRGWAMQQGYAFDDAGSSIRISSDAFSAVIRWRQVDLAADLATLPFATTDLVTGAALLDLTSEAWLTALATECNRHGCAALFALNYDGRIDWQPVLAEDAMVRDLLNAHQRGDKGFGDALGPLAGARFAKLLRGGHGVSTASTPWRLGPDHQALQSELLEGWAAAAVEQDPEQHSGIERWRAARQEQLADPSIDACLTVGHVDVLALPES